MKCGRPPCPPKPSTSAPKSSTLATKSSKIIDVDHSNTNGDNQSEVRPNPQKQSWVWNHFDDSTDPSFVICQVALKRGRVCGAKMKRDKSSSTKNLHGHLEKIHHLADPKLLKKTKTSHMDIAKWSKSGESFQSFPSFS